MKEGLWLKGVEVKLVVVKGFGRELMLLLTNVDKKPREILEIYLTRWKCEETFRFLKQMGSLICFLTWDGNLKKLKEVRPKRNERYRSNNRIA